MRNGKIRRFRPRSNNKHSARRTGHSNKTNGIHQVSFHRNGFRNGTTKNPHNLERLVEKYKNLAKEALSSGDEVLNQNYLQHSDHFSRILSEVNNLKPKNNSIDSSEEKKIDKQQEQNVSSIEEKK